MNRVRGPLGNPVSGTLSQRAVIAPLHWNITEQYLADNPASWENATYPQLNLFSK